MLTVFVLFLGPGAADGCPVVPPDTGFGLDVSNTRFVGCYISRMGGAIHRPQTFSACRIEDCQFLRCIAQEHTGGVYLEVRFAELLRLTGEECSSKWNSFLHIHISNSNSPSGALTMSDTVSFAKTNYYQGLEIDGDANIYYLSRSADCTPLFVS